MGKFDGILICTDLDGTLYKNDKSISIENKEAIEHFKSEGGYFTFITGRMPYYSIAAYNAVSPNAPFGCINGGGVFDVAANKYVFNRELPPKALELVQYIEGLFPDVGIQVCSFHQTFFAKENCTMERFRRVTGVPNTVCDYRSFSGPIGKILFGSDCEDDMLGIDKALKSHPLASEFSFIRSERSLYEILPKGVNKGLALEKLTEHLGLDRRKTVGIGDYDNDIGMFKVAGLGVAVANACKAALDAADHITVSNEEHAIARVIYDIESGKIVL